MSALEFLAELLGGAIACEVAHMAKDGSNDPVYKAKLQELIERNQAFEAARAAAETDTKSQ